MNIFDAPPKDAEWFLTKCEAVDLIHRNIETGQATGGDINHLKAIAGSQNPELSELSDDLWLSAKRLQDAVKTAIVALANRVGINAKELENEIFSAPSVSWLQAAAKIGQSQPITMPDRNAGKQGDETKRPRKATANELMLAEIERNPECVGWTIKEWQKFTKKAPATVHATAAWKRIHSVGAETRASKAVDRHGRFVKQKT